MRTYRARGYIYIESTGTEAEYDIDLEWTAFHEPTEMDVLNYMFETGDIQIMSSTIEEEEYA